MTVGGLKQNLIKNGDKIIVDLNKNKIECEQLKDNSVYKKRKNEWDEFEENAENWMERFILQLVKREMLSPTGAIMGRGLGQDVALITDGRFSGGSHGFVIGHITPEAYEGGVIAVVRNGDPITINAKRRLINLDLPEEEITKRLEKRKHKPRYIVLSKYAESVSSASLGAVTDRN